MRQRLAAAFGLARLAFGASLLATPQALGPVLIGDESGKPEVRTLLRFHGTRDLALGIGTLHAATGEGDTGPWLQAAIASDIFDAVVHLREWDAFPAHMRLPGVLASLAGAGVGAALLARR